RTGHPAPWVRHLVPWERRPRPWARRPSAHRRVHDIERMLGWALGVVAGERAVDRWLREEGLWTPSRAAWAELAAKHDRDTILASPIYPTPGFGSGTADYGLLHQLADDALARVWEQVRATVPVLLTRRSLTGHELGAMNGIRNADSGTVDQDTTTSL
ncbi:hypothetical protein ACWDTQ_32520, partial [Streptomyces cellulosae]